MDQRIEKLAQLLVHYSIRLKKGEMLRIQGEVCTLPLIKAVYNEAVLVGGNPYTRIVVPENEEHFLKHAKDDQLKFISPMEKFEVDKMETFITIWGSSNTRYLSGVDPQRQAMMRSSRSALIKKMFKRMGDNSLRWCGTLFPVSADAQEAEMSLNDWEDFVYNAGHMNAADPEKHWKKISNEQQRLVKILNQTDRLHFQSEGTDLKMRVKGRKWIECSGRVNFPDGEIFTGPIEDTVEGQIQFSYPAVYMGRVVENVKLEFKKGKVVKESAGKNQEFLISMLNMDKGARFVGEIAIGTNYDIKHFSKNILFDEKIGGTCHLAVGKSIDESGGKNISSLHWDMICDMHKGQITADGKVIYRNGKFVI